MSDEEIIVQLRSGNTSVLQFCYKKALAQVQGMITRDGGSIEDAKDLFHDALLILNKNCRNPDFKLSSSLSTYLYSICRYSWFNLQKKGKKKMELMVELDLSNMSLAYKSTSDLVERLMKAIDKLGGKCREILMDYYYGKQSYDEIARNLSYASGQVVRQQKYRCIQKLKELTDYIHVE